MNVRRGDVCLARLDPAVGSEQQKTRPVVVVQNDIDNRFSPVTIAVPVTSRSGDPAYPTQVLLPGGEGGLARPGMVLCNQVRALDKARLIRRLGTLGPDTMLLVDEGLRAALALDDSRPLDASDEVLGGADD